MDAATFPTYVERLRETFGTGRTRSLEWRRHQLEQLQRMLVEQEGRILEALAADLGKPQVEGYGAEIGFLKTELAHTLKHLASWAKPEKVPATMLNFKASSRVIREPLGVVLVIAPWNYPFQLLVSPMAGALAAGNCAVLKPSEITPATSALVAEILPQYVDPDAVVVVEGGVEETQALLEQRFDHIFFTGSTRVGKIVYKAAAEHLTPVTLELGGKSPCLVDADVNLEVAARRIVWGKFYNTGQTCVAPDYVLCHQAQLQPLLDAMCQVVREFFGEDPQQSADLGRIVSDAHFQRLQAFLEGNGRVVIGGQSDAASRFIAPTLLTDVSEDAVVMQEEIFGPILPVLPVADMDAAIRFVNARPKPLALYVFSSNRATQDKVLAQTSSGGACVNDTLAHLTVPELPFGGVGESGIGAYHGHHTFETFSHRKGVLDKDTWLDLPLRYPPYAGKLKWVKRVLG